jgi:SAM-dependent methyltransferase
MLLVHKGEGVPPTSRTRKEMNTPTAYTGEFYDGHEQGMLQSARIVVPLVLRLIRSASVLDVGCGRGAWLRVFQEQGVGAIRGLDGEYVDRSKLLVAPECFTSTDLSKPFEVPGRFDLAVCLEVGEHLPEGMTPVLVDQLVAAAPAVLFSAALPGQTGTGHVNERMPSDWRAHFRRHGYVLLDPIRPAVLTDPRVEPWYRQNIVLYASEELLRTMPELEVYRMPEEGLGIEWVQAYVLNNLLNRSQSLSSLSKQFPSALGRAFRRRADRVAGLFGIGPNTRA